MEEDEEDEEDEELFEHGALPVRHPVLGSGIPRGGWVGSLPGLRCPVTAIRRPTSGYGRPFYNSVLWASGPEHPWPVSRVFRVLRFNWLPWRGPYPTQTHAQSRKFAGCSFGGASPSRLA